MDRTIRQKLDRITNILWSGGVSNPATYIEQLSYLIYLKLLDEEESSRQQFQVGLFDDDAANGNMRSLFPSQAQRYRWARWSSRSGEDLVQFVRDEVFPYMASLVKERPRVAEYFRDAVLEINDRAVLKQVVDELDTVPFSRLGPDVKGDIFEYLLTHLGQSALNGQFRTPGQIRAMMVELVDPDAGDTILDPACGTGGFLIDAASYILAKYSETPRDVPIYGEDWLDQRGQTLEEARAVVPNLQTYRKGHGERIPDWQLLERSLFGFDVSRQMVRIASMNLVLHGLQDANVKRANTLSDLGGLTDEDLRREYRVILSNPPFAGVLPKESIRKDLPTRSKKSELLFLGVVLRSLAPGGRCAVVVPEGLLFQSSSSYRELRKMLVDEFDLQAVVSLPAGVFKPYAGVKTSVLVFRRPVHAQAAMTEHVWFYDVHADGYDPDRISGGGRVETPDRNDLPDLLSHWKAYAASHFRRPPGVEAGMVLTPDQPDPRCWWATKAAVKANGYALTASQYRPQVATITTHEDPAELIQELLQIEQNIERGLEELLTEVRSVHDGNPAEARLA